MSKEAIQISKKLPYKIADIDNVIKAYQQLIIEKNGKRETFIYKSVVQNNTTDKS